MTEPARPALPKLFLAALGLGPLFAWAYWPTLVNLVTVWNAEPDYSHGYLVAPAVLYFLWARRETCPGLKPSLQFTGLLFLGLSLAMRWAAARFYLETLDGWSILAYVVGVAWLLGGWPLLRWSGACLAFLLFMIPLPFRVERFLSLPMQSIATKLSCWMLQCLGQPALAEGHTILLGEHHLEVEQACSGLRILLGIVAIACAFVLLSKRAWWVNLVLVLSVVPITLLVNAVRIVLTGLLYLYASSETARHFSHDFAGWVVIPLAAALFGSVLWYLEHVLREVEWSEVSDFVRRRRSEPLRASRT